MASFTGVDDNTTQQMQDVGDEVTIALSGTYNMTILFQREVGAPGSGAYETLRTYTTANATVAEKHTTQRYGEKLRLYVAVDTSGTCVAVLSDVFSKGHGELAIRDAVGNDLLGFDQAGLLRYGGERHVSGGVVTVTASVTLTAAAHAGRILVGNAAAGMTVTMPLATGTGDVYTIFVGTTISSNSFIITKARSDVFNGAVALSTDIAGVTILANAADDTITMSGSTTGGVVGSWVRLTDVASAVWMLEGALCSTGNEADPMS